MEGGLENEENNLFTASAKCGSRLFQYISGHCNPELCIDSFNGGFQDDPKGTSVMHPAFVYVLGQTDGLESVSV